jgi:hypothetical protein
LRGRFEVWCPVGASCKERDVRLKSVWSIKRNFKMIIDFHTHIFPEGVKENREEYIKMDPAFQLLYSDKKARIIGAEELVASMDRARIDKSVIFGFPWLDQKLCIKTNDYLLSCMEKYPGRLIGFVSVSPLVPEGTVSEVERCVASGMKGIGEFAIYAKRSSSKETERIKEIMDVAKRLNVVLLVHINEPIGHRYPGKVDMTLKWVYDLILTCQGIDLILAHLGGGFLFYELMPEIKRVTARVYYDTAACPFLYSPKIYSVVASIVGAEKIIFGSDHPLIDQTRYIKDIENSGFSREDIQKILGENAKKLLKLS